MTTRTSTMSVTFRHPFRLAASDMAFPPGRYEVETDEEAYEAAGHTAYLRTATLLIVRRGGVTETYNIDPDELARARYDDGRRMPDAVPMVAVPETGVPWYRRIFLPHRRV